LTGAIGYRSTNSKIESSSMGLYIKTPLYQRRWSNRLGGRWVLSIMLSIAILLGQSMPLLAGHSSGPSQGWVEICGDGGSYFIRIGEDGQEQTPDCLHCVSCLASSGDASGPPLRPQSVADQVAFTQVVHAVYQPILPDNPEQYWSACRGPPIEDIKYNMTTPTLLILQEPAVTVLNTWGTPCV